MAPKLRTTLVLVVLFFLVPASSAQAVGLGEQRAMTKDEGPRAARAATTSPLIASPATCPEQDDLTAPVAAQEQTMICMINFARTASGLGALAEVEELDRSALGKAGDVLRCDSFSHFACGREFTYWIREAGYIGESCWHAGENLAWGTDEYGSVGAIFRAWMGSPTHRKNIFGDYEQIGIALVTGNLEGRRGAHVWATHLGSRCEG